MKSKLEKTLRVEPFRLMHTGNFYEFFINSWKEIDPEDIVYFGISTREFPEANSSIYSYAHDEKSSIKPIHYNSSHQVTAVYKTGYHSRLNLCDRKIMDKTLKEIIESFRDKQLPFDYFGDQGLKSKARDLYNIKEIEALICYDPLEVDIYRKLMSRRQFYLPLYLESENPCFDEEFNQRFVIVKGSLQKGRDPDDFQINIPNSFEELKQVPIRLEEMIKKKIESLKDSYKIIDGIQSMGKNQKSETTEEIQVNIKEKERLIERIKRISTQGRIPFPKEYEEKARILFSWAIREKGIPRYLYTLQT